MDGFADLVDKEKLPEAFLAFEILNQITLAQERGFSSDECLGVVPKCLASETVEVPVQVLNTLLNCYDHFIHSDPIKASLEKSFGFAAPKKRSRPFSQKLEKLHDHRYYASKVLQARIENFFKGTPISLATAFADTAANQKISYGTVKIAWGAHLNYLKSMLRRLKIPQSWGND